jgi:hypothetical protein
LDSTRSNRYQVQAKVDKYKYYFVQSANDNTAELYGLPYLESTEERLNFIDSGVGENESLFAVADHVEGGVHVPNPMQRESKAANEWPSSTLHPSESIPSVYQGQILSLGELLR